MAFEKVKTTSSRIENRISITRTATVGLPTFFCEKNNIKNFRYATFYFDKDNFKLGINFHNNNEEVHKFKIVVSEKYGAYIVSRKFFKMYGIKAEEYKGRYEWQYMKDFEVPIYVLELKKIL